MSRFLVLTLLISIAGFSMRNQVPLRKCPDSPNCVCSFTSTNDSHYMAPIDYDDDLGKALSKLKLIISKQTGQQLVQQNTNYLHYEFRSKLFGFIDDVEFYFDDENKKIHFRSASRSGYYDFGANRRRMNIINKNYAAQNN